MTAMSKSLSYTLPAEPRRYSPGLSSPLNFELHIVEDSGEPGAVPPPSNVVPKPSSRLYSTVASSPRFSPVPDLGLDSSIDVSTSLLSSQVESLVVLSPTITTTTTHVRGDLCHLREGSPSAKLTSSGLKAYSPIAKSPSPTSALVVRKTNERVSPMMTPSSFDLYLSNSEAKPISPMPSLSRSPLPTVSESPSLSLPKAVSPPLILSSSSSVVVPKSPSPKPLSGQPLSGLQLSTDEPSLDDALDKLLAMNFSRPENEAPITTSAASRLASEVQPEVYDETIVAAYRGNIHPYTHTESEMEDGLLEDQSDCRSDLDWADMELKMAYEGPDGSMTPMTEASWMDDSLTPSSCPGTPDAQMDLPMLHMVGTMDRISASGHVRMGLQCLFIGVLWNLVWRFYRQVLQWFDCQHVNQGCQILLLEGHLPAEFSLNQLIKVFSITTDFQASILELQCTGKWPSRYKIERAWCNWNLLVRWMQFIIVPLHPEILSYPITDNLL